MRRPHPAWRRWPSPAPRDTRHRRKPFLGEHRFRRGHHQDHLRQVEVRPLTWKRGQGSRSRSAGRTIQ
ncbi:hypothetical protein CKO22_15050 [Thiococcus pfennigii]|nr:hypothetical protein [Thiococcus pfennigii]